MLSRYDHQQVRITTEDGEVLTGFAEIFPSGYGLEVFGRAEESVAIGDTHIFLSQIKKIERLTDAVPELPSSRFDALMAELLESPCQIVDILPERVPADAGGQYFAVERYFRQPERLSALYRRFAELLLLLNCYHDMAVSFDSCAHWELNPDPEAFADRLTRLCPNDFLRAVFESQSAMIDLDPGDTYLTVYDPNRCLLDTIKKLAQAEGLFVWEAE